MFEGIAERVNADPAIVRWGRHMNETFMVQVGEAQYLVTVAAGRVEKVERGPFVMRPWRFAVRASAEAWGRLWQPTPEPGWHDLSALAKRGYARLEGDLHPLMANLQYVKDLLALPRRIAGGRS